MVTLLFVHFQQWFIDWFVSDWISGGTEPKKLDSPIVDEVVPLPDLNEGKPDEYFYGGDPSLWDVSDEPDDDEDLVPYDEPLYQNQEEDPEVQRIKFEFDQHIDEINQNWWYLLCNKQFIVPEFVNFEETVF